MRTETRHTILRIFLYLAGSTTLLAFAAAVMPGEWMIWIADVSGIADFPEHPLTWYLARHLSAMYGLFGVGILIMATDLDRYLPLLRVTAWGLIALGFLQFAIDSSAPMPAYWTWSEASSSAFGGLCIMYLARKDSQEQ